MIVVDESCEFVKWGYIVLCLFNRDHVITSIDDSQYILTWATVFCYEDRHIDYEITVATSRPLWPRGIIALFSYRRLLYDTYNNCRA